MFFGTVLTILVTLLRARPGSGRRALGGFFINGRFFSRVLREEVEISTVPLERAYCD